MLAEAAGVSKIIIACGRTDLRKGIDGLAQLIGTKYDMNPFEKNVLFFSVADAETGSKGSCGRVTDFCFYTRDWKTAPSHGLVLLRKQCSLHASSTKC